jgi:hypothetical protein
MEAMRRLLVSLTALWLLTAVVGCCCTCTHGICDCDNWYPLACDYYGCYCNSPAGVKPEPIPAPRPPAEQPMKSIGGDEGR